MDEPVGCRRCSRRTATAAHAVAHSFSSDRPCSGSASTSINVDARCSEAWRVRRVSNEKDWMTEGDGADSGQERKNDTHALTTDPRRPVVSEPKNARRAWRIWGTLMRTPPPCLAQATPRGGRVCERRPPRRCLSIHWRFALQRQYCPPTRPRTRPTASTRCARSTRRPMSHRTTPDAAGARSMPARHAMRATR